MAVRTSTSRSLDRSQEEFGQERSASSVWFVYVDQTDESIPSPLQTRSLSEWIQFQQSPAISQSSTSFIFKNRKEPNEMDREKGRQKMVVFLIIIA